MPASRAPRIATPAPSLMTASAALAQLLLNRFQPFSESPIQGARFSWRDLPLVISVKILH